MAESRKGKEEKENQPANLSQGEFLRSDTWCSERYIDSKYTSLRIGEQKNRLECAESGDYQYEQR